MSGFQEIRVPLSTNAQGVYRVVWTTVSTLDGHAARGSFLFGVGVSPSGPVEFGGGATPARGDLFIAIARWVEALGLVLAVGMLLPRRLARGRPDLSWVRPPLRPVLLVTFAAGVAVLLAEAASATGSPSPIALWRYLSTGLPGLARVTRIGLEGLAVAAAFLGAPSLWAWALGAIGALAASGHGAAVHPAWWGITVDAVHLGAAGVWAGGILAFGVLRPPGGWRGPEARALLVRFSPPALTAFAVTVGFGAIQALQELRTVRALTGSRYGQVLLAKIALVGLMVPLSVVAWRLRRPHFRFEGTLAVLVVAAAAILAAFPVPPSRLV
jgi:copper transport protein